MFNILQVQLNLVAKKGTRKGQTIVEWPENHVYVIGNGN